MASPNDTKTTSCPSAPLVIHSMNVAKIDMPTSATTRYMTMDINAPISHPMGPLNNISIIIIKSIVNMVFLLIKNHLSDDL